MSGYDLKRFPYYSLTFTQAFKMHDPGCERCNSLHEIFQVHLEPHGFTLEPNNYDSFLIVDGPGIGDGDTELMWRSLGRNHGGMVSYRTEADKASFARRRSKKVGA